MSKTIVGELIDLYAKYGGDVQDLKGNETTAEMLDAIEKIIVPVVGSPFFIVNGAVSDDYTSYTGDKTGDEIVAAVKSGKQVILKDNQEDFYNNLMVISMTVVNTSKNIAYDFMFINETQNEFEKGYFQVNDENKSGNTFIFS